VRCPDIAKLLLRDRENKFQHHICKYNIIESECTPYIHDKAEWKTEFEYEPHCKLSGCDICPGYRRQKELGNKEKNFKIDNVTYRKLASTAHYLVKESKTKTLFLTLTFPEFKDTKYNNYSFLTETEKKTFTDDTNKAFSKFVENLRINYGCCGYIAVREFGHKYNRVHYHLLCAIPYHSFTKLNTAWCAAISDISVFSRNALTTDPRTKFVKDPIRAMRYVCKYFSKAKGQRSSSRLVFVSNNILQRPKNMDAPLESVLDSFNFDYMKQTSDFTTCYRITDNKEFLRFCDQFLYPFFELSHKKSQYLYSFPIDSS
jgi:hypothetical protein